MARTEPLPILSDHAVLRYAERVLGIPIRRAVEEQVFSDPSLKKIITSMQKGRVNLAQARACLVVMDGRVVTIIGNENKRKKRAK